METVFKIINTSANKESPFDRQERISWWDQKKLRDAKVIVVGAGAIGNETLKNLALLGIGNVMVCDMDVISTSNLSRTVLFKKDDVGKKKAIVAAERFKEMNLEENAMVDCFIGDIVWDLGTGVYRYFDVVLGCLDNVETRFKVNRMCWMASRPFIDAGINELAGSVSVFNAPKTACYECNASESQYKAARVRYSCDDFKKRSISEGRAPTTQVASALVSAMQVQEAVKIICNKQAAYGKKIYYQGTNNAFDLIDLKKNENCLAHVSYDKVIETGMTNQTTAGEFLDFVSRAENSGANSVIDLRGDRSFLQTAKCRFCGKAIDVYKPSFRIFFDELICDSCKSKDITKDEHEERNYISDITLSSDSKLLNMSLDEIGFPKLHIIAVRNAEGSYKYYELSGDLHNVMPNIHKGLQC
ncbi:MAG: ThiF family adenylyltransferase [Tannerellaceae bacterium]|jgi:adenylyltransferase/sulfurtransferase|nr:ThiF family adenylyltransferase [Tannerellaceae bacterium]